MPKAAPAKTEEKKITKAAFLKALDKKAAVAKVATKKERQTYLDDTALLQKLGLGPGESATFTASVSNISFLFAKDDPNRPMFIFNYVIESDESNENGVIVGNNFILEEGKNKEGEIFRTEQESQEQLFGEFQGLGEDTSEWATSKNPLHDAVTAAEEHTKNKTPISITIKHWSKPPKSGMNVRVNGPLADDDNSDLETDEEEYEDAEGESDFDASEWIDGWVEFDHEEYGSVRMKVEAYDEDADVFTGTDENGEEWTADYGPKPDVVVWSENQDD